MFRRRDKDHHQSKDPPAPADVYLGLRSQILTLDPNRVGLGGRSGARRIMGCLMETGYPNGTATLVCLSDGTTSLYTSSGFGIIGGGEHEAVVRENPKLLEVLNDQLAHLSPSTDQSLPREGRTIIRAVTADGQRLNEPSETELGEGRSVLSPVFHAHGVMTHLRLSDEANH
jgi:hypothetical protein